MVVWSVVEGRDCQMIGGQRALSLGRLLGYGNVSGRTTVGILDGYRLIQVLHTMTHGSRTSNCMDGWKVWFIDSSRIACRLPHTAVQWAQVHWLFWSIVMVPTPLQSQWFTLQAPENRGIGAENLGCFTFTSVSSAKIEISLQFLAITHWLGNHVGSQKFSFFFRNNVIVHTETIRNYFCGLYSGMDTNSFRNGFIFRSLIPEWIRIFPIPFLFRQP